MKQSQYISKSFFWDEGDPVSASLELILHEYLISNCQSVLWGATYCELRQVSVQILSHGDQTDNKNSVRGCNRKSSNKQADFWGELN